MKTARKVLLLVLCAALLVSATVMGTLAYLTDNDSVKNTFTVGKVDINLNETDVTKTDGSKTEEGNAYHLLPGQTYVKDPTVTVLKDSEESYVRILVTVNDISKLTAAFPKDDNAEFYAGDVFLLQNLVTGWDNATWQYVSYNNGTYEFRYKETVSAPTADVTLPALFTNVVIPGNLDNAAIANLNGVEISIVAHAIQAEGFADAAAAWAAWTN